MYFRRDIGDLVIVKLVGKNLSFIVSNVYAPNDHNEEYFDHLKDIMLDIQIVHPTLPVIMLGDFNIVLEVRNSIHPFTPNSGFTSGTPVFTHFTSARQRYALMMQ